MIGNLFIDGRINPGELVHITLKAAACAVGGHVPAKDLPNRIIQACQHALGRDCPELQFRWSGNELHIIAFIGEERHAYAFFGNGAEILPGYPHTSYVKTA